MFNEPGAIAFNPHKEINHKKLKELEDLLFPNRTRHIYDINRRKVSTDVPVCVVCSGLTTCTILENLMIQEVYLPSEPVQQGTCKVLDALGARIATDIFGPTKAYRDTAQCREIVMQYLCLFWGSQNLMYTNECIDYERAGGNEDPLQSPRYPCKGFCIQVAQLCGNDDQVLQLCNNIECPPPTEEDCTPDPSINGIVLDGRVGCSLPLYDNPYAGRACKASTHSISSVSLLMILILISLLMVKM